MDVTKYNIYRVVTEKVFNNWSELLFERDEVVHCIYDLGSAWLAKRINTDATPRMLPNDECRELTEKEKELYK